MLSHRARVGRTPVLVRRQWLIPALLLGGLVALAGCGSNDRDKAEADAPSKDAVACRDKWKDLGDEVGDRDSKTEPSALAQRWNSIAATVDYYATSAKAGDCDPEIAGHQKAMNALTAFSAKLRPYDMEARLALVKAAAEQYASSPRPPAPKPSPSKKGNKQKPAPQAAKPAAILAAVKSFTRQAPLATEQQGAGWQQARVVDLADAAAVAKTVKDLAFLSTESPGYRACIAALAQIRTALHAGS